LSNNPPGFFADEADIGYGAYLLLQGKIDHHFYFESFDVYRPFFPYYASLPFISIFGLTEFGTRLGPALFGTITVLIFFMLIRKITHSSFIALLASFSLAISPWHIHFSRTGFEYSYLPFFLLLGTYLFISRHLLLASLAFGISFYTYHPAILQSLGIFCSLHLLFFKKKYLSQHVKSFILFFILLIPLINGVMNGGTTARFEQISLLSQKDLTANEMLSKFLDVYLAHFSSNFLFSKGDIDYPGQFITRHSVRGMGQLYGWQSLFILAGCIALVTRNNKIPASQVTS
jgi:hypothetical protein